MAKSSPLSWLLLTVLALASPAAARPVRAMPAEAFIDTLGVNMHLGYGGTPYDNIEAIETELKFLGVSHVRQNLYGKPRNLGFIGYLGANGVRFDFVFVSGGGSFDPASLATSVDPIARSAPGVIDAIEGFNEINNWPVTYQGVKSEASSEAAMAALYRAVHADPLLQGVPVYDMTGAGPTQSIAGRADFANAHPYPHNASQPRLSFEGYAMPAAYPRVITEIGNFSLPLGWPKAKPYWEGYTMLGVDELTQAKGVLNTYLAAAEQGVSRTYVYELADEHPDPTGQNAEAHYGLFHNDNSPKPSAIALHRLVSFLEGGADGHGAASAPKLLDYSLVGAPSTLHQLLLQKADGTFVLVLWNDVPFWHWDGPTSLPVNAAAVEVKAQLMAPVRRYNIFDPLTGEANTHEGKTADFSVAVTDHAMLIEMIP